MSLYTPSETTVELGRRSVAEIRQETDYPSSGHVVVRLDPSKPARFPLQLRIPKWCQKATMSVNGQPWNKPIAAGTFLAVDRQWKPGDQVTLDLPMDFRFVLGRKRQAGRAALMRGPVVFCLNPAHIEFAPGMEGPYPKGHLAWLHNMDGVDLGRNFLNPDSLKLLPNDNSVRPGGVACEVKAGAGWTDVRHYAELSFRLTEFPDPQGKCSYFRLPDPSIAVPDELATGDGVQRNLFK